MEVHHHSHHPKKFKEYITEFVMLFAAVTLGFFAENLREHMVESEREEVYMNALVEDLKIDTARISYSISRLEGNILNTDTLLNLYVKGLFKGADSKLFAAKANNAGHSIDVVFNDRTSSQLKGTGSIRLIKKKHIADSLMMYWNNQIKLDQIHSRYEETRQRQRESGFRTFKWYIGNFKYGGGKLDVEPEYNDYILDAKNVPELVNITSSLYNISRTQYIKELRSEKNLAETLIKEISNSYHLEGNKE